MTSTLNSLPIFITRRASREVAAWCAANPERADEMRAAFGSDEYKAEVVAERARRAAVRFAESETILADAADIVEAKSSSASIATVVAALRGGHEAVARFSPTPLDRSALYRAAANVADAQTSRDAIANGVSARNLQGMRDGLAGFAAYVATL